MVNHNNMNENEVNINRDQTFDRVKEITAKDNEIATPAIDEIMGILKKNLDSKSDFEIRHGYVALAKCIVFLSQALCTDEIQYKNEIEQSYRISMEKIIASLEPKIENGKITDENFDQEDLSVRRIMMSLAQSIEYIVWRMILSSYSEIRKEIEEDETN